VDDEGVQVTDLAVVPAAQPAPADDALTPAGRNRRRLALRVARVAFTGAVLGGVAYAAARQWPEVRHTLATLAWPAVLLSMVAVLGGLTAQTFGWRAALRDMGHRVSVTTAGQIYLIGLLAKYLPGSIWSFVLTMELGRRAKVPRSRAFLASLVALALSTTAALTFGVFGLPVLFRISGVITVLVLVLVPLALVVAHPKVLTWFVQRFLALMRRAPLPSPFTWRGVGAVLGWSAVAWLCFGLHLWLLTGALAAPGARGYLSCLGAIALGLTAGTYAFLSPSGLGVREAIVATALLPYVSPGVALALALASRMVFTVSDLVAAGVAALTGLRILRAVADPASSERVVSEPVVPSGQDRS
jgi:glycosyltransferase 2 family protein